jgi:glycosyltransferase involved in cell wall biosynthesis
VTDDGKAAPVAGKRGRPACLYLATFDPTASSTGTSTRGKLFLRFFAERFDTHLVYMKEKHAEGRDPELRERLAGVSEIDYSPWSYFFFSPKLLRAARKTLERRPVQFIFADFEKAGFYAYLLSRRSGTPYIYNSHNVEYLRYLDVAPRNPLRYAFVPYIYLLERVACKKSRFTVAISEPDSKSFLRWTSPDRVVVAPCTFDEDSIHGEYEDAITERPVVLMVGNYRNAGNRDGAYTLVEEVVPKVVERYPGIVFRCIGRDFPEELNHPNVEAPGFVDDLLAEYAKATVVVAPISMGGGIKIKVIEGLASGKYVVATEKAMEGIRSEELSNLEIVPLEQFPRAIIEAVEQRPTKTDRNWRVLAEGYGIKTQLRRLADRIERETALGT